ncbi:MAG: LCP family protein [Gaiellaceae bacterium]
MHVSLPSKRPKLERPPTGNGAPRKGGGLRRLLPRRRWLRWVGIVVILLVVLMAVWFVASYLALRSGAQQANARLGQAARQALSPGGGFLFGGPSTILVLGTDHSTLAQRASDQHSDSIMVIRADSSRHRLSYLSIPRDLFVSVPGHGLDRINSAFQIGGLPLAIRTVSSYTGLPLNHVIVVDFSEFRRLIDALGGVDINVPKPILSNRFDCPYPTQSECLSKFKGWSFPRGAQHMDGHRALIYSRIRENQLDPGESDFTRAARQQQVVQAVLGKITGVGTMLRLPFIGSDLMAPMATDLSAGDLIQLGWIKLRASHVVYCRLGGTGTTTAGGASVIQPDSAGDASVINMFKGAEALHRVETGNPYAPRCSAHQLVP